MSVWASGGALSVRNGALLVGSQECGCCGSVEPAECGQTYPNMECVANLDVAMSGPSVLEWSYAYSSDAGEGAPNTTSGNGSGTAQVEVPNRTCVQLSGSESLFVRETLSNGTTNYDIGMTLGRVRYRTDASLPFGTAYVIELSGSGGTTLGGISYAVRVHLTESGQPLVNVSDTPGIFDSVVFGGGINNNGSTATSTLSSSVSVSGSCSSIVVSVQADLSVVGNIDIDQTLSHTYTINDLFERNTFQASTGPTLDGIPDNLRTENRFGCNGCGG